MSCEVLHPINGAFLTSSLGEGATEVSALITRINRYSNPESLGAFLLSIIYKIVQLFKRIFSCDDRSLTLKKLFELEQRRYQNREESWDPKDSASLDKVALAAAKITLDEILKLESSKNEEGVVYSISESYLPGSETAEADIGTAIDNYCAAVEIAKEGLATYFENIEARIEQNRAEGFAYEKIDLQSVKTILNDLLPEGATEDTAKQWLGKAAPELALKQLRKEFKPGAWIENFPETLEASVKKVLKQLVDGGLLISETRRHEVAVKIVEQFTAEYILDSAQVSAKHLLQANASHNRQATLVVFHNELNELRKHTPLTKIPESWIVQAENQILIWYAKERCDAIRADRFTGELPREVFKIGALEVLNEFFAHETDEEKELINRWCETLWQEHPYMNRR